MTKKEYIKKLRRALFRFDEADKKKTIDYYSEMIDDAMEDGKSEAQAVSEMDDVEAVIEKLSAENEIKPRQKMSKWVIAFLIIGFPLWFSILIAVGSCVLAVYLTIWSILISLIAVIIVFCAMAIAGLVMLVVLFSVNAPSALFIFGACLICAAIGFALIYPVSMLVAGVCKATARACDSAFRRIRGRA